MTITREGFHKIENYYRKQDEFGKRCCIDFMRHLLIAYSKSSKEGIIILLDKEFERYYGNFATLFLIEKVIKCERTDKESHFSVHVSKSKRFYNYEGRQYTITFKIIDEERMMEVLQRFAYLLHIKDNDTVQKAFHIGTDGREICLKKTIKGYEIDKHDDILGYSTERLTQDKAVKLLEILIEKQGRGVKSKDILRRKNFLKSESELHKTIRVLRNFLGEGKQEKAKDFQYLLTGKDGNNFTYNLVALKTIDLVKN